MPWQGQTVVRTDGTRTGQQVWQDARSANVKIVADGHDNHDQDLADSITLTVRKDGGNTATGNLPMGNFRHTGVGNATARTEYASAADIQDGGLTYTASVGGTGDVVTIALALAPTNYTGGQTLSWVVAADNTGAVTVNVNGLGPKALEKSQVPLVAKDLTTGDTAVIVFDVSRDAFQLLSHQRSPVFTQNGAPLPQGSLYGLTLSNNATDAVNDIDIAPGNARDASNTANLVVSTAIGKRIDATWAAGGTPATPTGGLSSSLSPVQNDTTYHMIVGLVAGVTEIGFDTDPTGSSLVTDHSFTNPRRIGSVLRGTATNLGFTQDGDEFLLNNPVADYNATNPGTAAVLRALTVPAGIKTVAIHAFDVFDNTIGANTAALVTSPDQADTVPVVIAGPFTVQVVGGVGVAVSSGTEVRRRTDTSRQIRTRLSNSDADVSVTGTTMGWVDRRDR